jgi:two-component system LytT family sensor kinase
MPPPPHNMEHNRFGWRRILPFTIPGTIMMFLLILIISGGIKIINQWFKSERRTEEIEKEKISTELALLKSQVNPHFLFNTLNNIYALAVANNAGTATAVMKLSAIMRYVLDDAKSNFVPLDKEIDFLENYISLQRVRITEKSTIHFTVLGNTTDKQIAPLLLITFVENAFKYGISTHQPAIIDISLKANQKFNSSANGELHGSGNTGIGITNAKRRLDLMYHNKHSLLTENNASSFLIILTLDLI